MDLVRLWLRNRWLWVTAGVLVVGYALGASWQPWHPFSSDVWGTVGQWISTIVSSVSVLLVVYVIIRDKKDDEEELARQISVHTVARGEDLSKPWQAEIHFTIYNSSDNPIFDPIIFLTPWTSLDRLENEISNTDKAMRQRQKDAASGLQPKPLRYTPPTGEPPIAAASIPPDVTAANGRDQVAPHGSLNVSTNVNYPHQIYDHVLYFIDAKGRAWFLDIGTRQLKRIDPMVHRTPDKDEWRNRVREQLLARDGSAAQSNSSLNDDKGTTGPGIPG